MIVAWGIREMRHAGERRAAEQDQRHTEAMTALESLVRQSNAHTAALHEVLSGQRQIKLPAETVDADQLSKPPSTA